jgi:hypothetical protein
LPFSIRVRSRPKRHRSPDYESGGQEFESLRARYKYIRQHNNSRERATAMQNRKIRMVSAWPMVMWRVIRARSAEERRKWAGWHRNSDGPGASDRVHRVVGAAQDGNADAVALSLKLGSTPRSGRGGRRFKSYHSDQHLADFHLFPATASATASRCFENDLRAPDR